MEPTNQAEFNGWAKVEVMGHQSHIGKVTTQVFGAAVLFRVDTPEIPEREETLTTDRWTGAGHFTKGSVVKHAAIPARTVLIGAGSIYQIHPCTEAVAIAAIISGSVAPLSLISAGAKAFIEATNDEDDEEREDQDEDLFFEEPA